LWSVWKNIGSFVEIAGKTRSGGVEKYSAGRPAKRVSRVRD
jgi:hypothetical protein